MENQVPKKLTKKAARLQVKQALLSLSDLEETLGKKKFKRRMQKAEKILADGLPKNLKIKKLKVKSVA